MNDPAVMKDARSVVFDQVSAHNEARVKQKVRWFVESIRFYYIYL